MKNLSFVIPCYRSEKTIEKVILEIEQVVSQKTEYDYEIICVNDFSPDGVFIELSRLAVTNDKVKVVNLAKNVGKHGAVLAGYSFAKGDYIINLDDDCQSPVPELWRLIEPLEKNECDCAMALYDKKKQAFWKNAGSSFNAWVGSVMLERPDGFRFDNFWAIKKFVLDEIIKYQNPYPYLEGLLLRVTQRIVQVPMHERERGDDNQTGYTFKKSISLFANGFTAFSIKPLRISSFVGFVAAIVGFAMAITVFTQKISGKIQVLGYTTSVILQLIIGGMILMCLGMMGEYVGRIYICLNKSPQYVIESTINLDNK